MCSRELWLVQENHATHTPQSSSWFSWNEIENLQIKKKMLEKSNQCLSSEQPCQAKSLDVSLNIAGIEKLCLENSQSWSTLGAIWFEFWKKGVLSTVDICVLELWLEFLKSLWYSVGDTLKLQYSWLWPVASYTLFAAVPWNRLENWEWKARLYVFTGILTDFEKQCFDVLFLTSICVNNYFENENF